MPLYDYECARCAHRFEMIMKVGEANPACPACARRRRNGAPPPFRTNSWSRFLDGMEKRVSPHKYK